MNELLYKKKLATSRASLKQAAVGSSPDIPYEQALANIAHDYLRSRAPSLLEFEIGFQLVDKSKGGEKALGAFGFKIGNRDLIVPVVYYDGEVSGHEVVYVVDQNICVPSTEAWVSYLTQKQPDAIGTQVPSNRSNLGIRGAALNMITRSPLKFASEQAKAIADRYPAWCQPFVGWMAKIATAKLDEQMNWAPSLSDYFAKQPMALHETYMQMLKDYPAMKSAAEKMNQTVYKELEKSIDAAVDRSKLPRIFGSVLGEPKKDKSMIIIKYTEAAKAVVPYDLDDASKEKLVRKGYFIQDKRKADQKPKIYPNPINQETLQLQNPTANTIANVLVRPGNFERCLVLVSQVNPSRQPIDCANIIRLSDKRLCSHDKSSSLVEDDALDIKEFTDFLEKLPKAKDYSFKDEGTYVILTTGKGIEATCAFSSHRSLGKQGDDTVVSMRPRSDFNHRSVARFGGKSQGYDDSPCQLRISEKATSIRAWKDEVIVPADAKVLKVEDGYSSSDKFLPGDMRDLAAVMWKGLSRMDVRRGHSAGREYTIDMDTPVSKSAAVLKMVEKHGLDESEAEAALEMVPAGQSMTFAVKKADGAPPWLIDKGQSQSPNLPWQDQTGGNMMANPNVNNDSTTTYNLPVEGMVASQNDPSAWDPRIEPDLPQMQQALQAANQGQRDVFNVKSILSIVNKDQSGDMGPILKCLDALGRRYLAFRWQREDMNDQYGTADASDIEDSLLENFENLGEMVIAMYERDLRNGDRSELLKDKLTVHSEDTGDNE